MSALRRQQTEAVLSGFAGAGVGLTTAVSEVDFTAAFAKMLQRTSLKVALGLRLAMWIAIVSPIFVLGRLRTMGGLTPAERAQVLDALLRHRWFAIRELTVLLKLTASLAMFAVPSVRARCGYDERQRLRGDESGERLRLPLVDVTEDAEVA